MLRTGFHKIMLDVSFSIYFICM
uniref:Uncharacterized protein n=1 Tax=Anguilla anguilla TaxID=7936 RepID=A0A0E9VP66_ANGAN